VAARGWYEKAAAQGNPRAWNNLGVLYEAGLGIKANRAKAIEYYRRAAAANDDLAIQNMKRLGAR
jgi:TPR repeat protein